MSDGTRTHDRLDHNQELYQLSYAHRGLPNLASPRNVMTPAKARMNASTPRPLTRHTNSSKRTSRSRPMPGSSRAGASQNL